MLSFNTRELDSAAAHVDGVLSADDPIWQEGDPMPAPALQVTGRLSSAGHHRYFWSGRIEGAIESECRRCLEPVRAEVAADVQALFADAGDEEADDPDVYRLDPKTGLLDLRPAVREQWLLEAPAFVLCRDDCRGLCPVCGADRNSAECECVPSAADGRWDALRSLRT